MKSKKILTMAIIFCLLILNTVVYAEKISVNTRVYAPCGNYGLHDMVASGAGFVYDASGRNLTFVGNAFGCANSGCYEVVITEGRVASGLSIKRYVTTYAEIVPGGAVLYTDKVYYTSKNSLPGYNFRYR